MAWLGIVLIGFGLLIVGIAWAFCRAAARDADSYLP